MLYDLNLSSTAWYLTGHEIDPERVAEPSRWAEHSVNFSVVFGQSKLFEGDHEVERLEVGPYETGDILAAMRFCSDKTRGELCEDPSIMAALGCIERGH